MPSYAHPPRAGKKPTPASSLPRRPSLQSGAASLGGMAITPPASAAGRSTPVQGWGQSFAHIPVSPAPPQVQTKLKINQPGDKYEQEADRVADQVMRMPEPRPLVKSRFPAGSPPPITVFDPAPRPLQRKCAVCEKNDEERHLQREATGTAATPAYAPSIVQQVLNTPGQPLDAATRRFFEPRFGVNLSSVRTHTDASAAASAQHVNARAYTVGSHIVFGVGESPHDDAHLMSHELTHTMQQAAIGSPAAETHVQRKPDERCPSGETASRDTESIIGVALSTGFERLRNSPLATFLRLHGAGRINAEDREAVLQVMRRQEAAVRRLSSLNGSGSTARGISDQALVQSGYAFAMVGGLLADDLTIVGTADDVVIPPAVIYGAGAAVIGSIAYLTYLAFAPSQEEVEQAAEDVERLTQELMETLDRANRRARPERRPEPESERRPPAPAPLPNDDDTDQRGRRNRMRFQVQWDTRRGGPTFSEVAEAPSQVGVSLAAAVTALQAAHSQVLPTQARDASLQARLRQERFMASARAGGGLERGGYSHSEYFDYRNHRDARVDVENVRGHNLRH